jgi:glycerophosphoryl diester phosphodiesterase
VIRHRAAARVAPENTIASFERAFELGADGIETDVCVTRDGRRRCCGIFSRKDRRLGPDRSCQG